MNIKIHSPFLLVFFFLFFGVGCNRSNENINIVSIIKNNNVQDLKAHLHSGYDPNSCIPRIGSPLMIAARYGNFEILKMLIEHGADVKYQCDNMANWELIDCAASGKNIQLFTFLLEEYPELLYSSDKLMKVASTLSTECIIKKIVNSGIDPKCENYFHAIDGRRIEIVKYFLESNVPVEGCEYNINSSSLIESQSYSPLMYLIDVNIEEKALLLEEFLKRGGNPNHYSKSGETPLSLAIKKGEPDIVKVLLEYGVDLNKKPNHKDYKNMNYIDISNKLQRHDCKRILEEFIK